MEMANRWAFKEWAVVCEALASGRQSLILRKGGIHEGAGGFQVEHPEFWLFATRFHQNRDELSDESHSWFDALETQSHPEGMILLRGYAVVKAVHRLTDERQLASLAGCHVLSERTVSERFHYRTPGLFVLSTRIHVPPKPLWIPDSPHFGGCRTWVDLPQELPTSGLLPVLSDAEFERANSQLATRFGAAVC